MHVMAILAPGDHHVELVATRRAERCAQRRDRSRIGVGQVAAKRNDDIGIVAHGRERGDERPERAFAGELVVDHVEPEGTERGRVTPDRPNWSAACSDERVVHPSGERPAVDLEQRLIGAHAP